MATISNARYAALLAAEKKLNDDAIQAAMKPFADKWAINLAVCLNQQAYKNWPYWAKAALDYAYKNNADLKRIHIQNLPQE